LRVVVDTNKIIAALVKPGRVRMLLLALAEKPLTPGYSRSEIMEHRGEILRKTGYNPRELDKALQLVYKYIKETEPGREYIEEARVIAGRFDVKDTPFIALALQEDAVVWTNDRGMLGEAVRGGYREYTAVDTTGLQMLLEGKSKTEVLEAMREKYLEG